MGGEGAFAVRRDAVEGARAGSRRGGMDREGKRSGRRSSTVRFCESRMRARVVRSSSIYSKNAGWAIRVRRMRFFRGNGVLRLK